MTIEPETNKKKFVSQTLPWLIAAGALLVYLATLNRWVTLGNLSRLVQLGRWDGQLPIYSPLYVAVTHPLSWLPVSWQPLALNLFALVCAVLTLVLLARSVMLLPQDRTHEQRLRERSEFSLLSIRAAWLPPVLAVLVCGLQLTFWQNATAGTAEMFDLLLFAYVIRCLLEYRIEQRESWLSRFALVYGLAIPNNWAMIGFAPAFLVALVWVKGLSFFNWRFLVRMAACGAVGLLLYLLLPLVHTLSSASDTSFWPVLKANLKAQKDVLVSFPRYLVLLLGLTSLLPAFVMGIRWASFLGDTNTISLKLTPLMFHVLHGLFLVACIVVAFDPPFSPRKLGMGIPFLTFYYLGALSIGYFCGYCLLVFGVEPVIPRPRATFLQQAVNRTVTSVIWIALVAVPVMLIYQNLPPIRANKGPALTEFADLVAKSLPPKGAVVLSDDPRRLYLLAATLHRNETADKYILLDTRSMPLPQYQKSLSQQYHERWTGSAGTNYPKGGFAPLSLIQIVANLSRSNDIYYLHPSFGYYFERFYMRPHGLVYELKTHSTNSISAPLLTQSEIAENQTFWQQIENDVLSPLPRLIKQHNFSATLLGTFYSRALNYWGVELQKNGQLNEAAPHFARALELNADNVVAQINLDFNQSLRAGKKTPSELLKSVEDKFGKYRNWSQILGENAPFDEPNFCFEQGRAFAKGRNYRQAAQQFDRAATLAPDNLAARLWLGQLMIMWRMPDKVLELVVDIRAHPDTLPLDRASQIELIRLEAIAHFAKTNAETANNILQAAQKQYPDDTNLLAVVTQVQMAFGHHTEALATVEKLLKIAPDDPQALLNKGALCIQLKTFKEAIAPLNRLLDSQPDNNSALINRAIASLQTGELDAAQRDYEKLKIAFPSAFQIYYGLGEIAFRKKERQAAINNYELYLKHAPANTEERKLIDARLNGLKNSPP